MRPVSAISRRAFTRRIGLALAGLALSGANPLFADCKEGGWTVRDSYPDVDLKDDDPMPVSFSDVLLLPSGKPDLVAPYGVAPQQFGELWIPQREGAVPVVVLIHGGCWQSAYDIEHIRPAAAALKNAGYAVWAVEYRRIGDPGGGWPGTFEDIARAVDILDELLESHALQAGPKIVMGHSAGGQLALWAAARPQFSDHHSFYAPDSMSVDHVVGLAAITDLKTYASGESSCEQSTVELLGEPEHHAERYDAVSPVELPVLRIPSLLVQGADDPIVPMDQAAAYHQLATQAGAPSRVLELPDAGHFDLIHPRTAAWRAVISELERCL